MSPLAHRDFVVFAPLAVVLACIAPATESVPSTGPPGGGGSSPGTAEPGPLGDPPGAEPTGSGPPANADGGEPAALRGILAAHNAVRARHCAPPLVWSAELAAVAQRWADQLRNAGCAFDHSQTQYGENLAAATAGSLDHQGVVDMWYREIDQYDFARGGFTMATGHFTQVVWAGSQRLGCGLSSCGGMQTWVCNYDPPGNYGGQFDRNVVPATCAR